MSHLLSLDQLHWIRLEAQSLVERASDHENHIETLIAAAESDLRHAEAALSDAFDVANASIEQLRDLLGAQLQQRVNGVATARQLCAGAHEQYVAARKLQTHLGREFGTDQKGRLRDAVLVVDDYGDVCEALALVLQDAGFVVRTATNGLEALLAAYEMRPAVIVMDVSMPVLDGIEATRLIKATEATRHARVIAFTSDPPGAGHPSRKLFEAVLQKPTTPAVVLATVRHVAKLSATG